MEYEEFTKQSKELALELADAIEKQSNVEVVIDALYVLQISLAQKLETQEKGLGFEMLIDLILGLSGTAKAILNDGND